MRAADRQHGWHFTTFTTYYSQQLDVSAKLKHDLGWLLAVAIWEGRSCLGQRWLVGVDEGRDVWHMMDVASRRCKFYDS
jgi:hypothetical protein